MDPSLLTGGALPHVKGMILLTGRVSGLAREAAHLASATPVPL